MSRYHSDVTLAEIDRHAGADMRAPPASWQKLCDWMFVAGLDQSYGILRAYLDTVGMLETVEALVSGDDDESRKREHDLLEIVAERWPEIQHQLSRRNL